MFYTFFIGVVLASKSYQNKNLLSRGWTDGHAFLRWTDGHAFLRWTDGHVFLRCTDGHYLQS